MAFISFPDFEVDRIMALKHLTQRPSAAQVNHSVFEVGLHYNVDFVYGT